MHGIRDIILYFAGKTIVIHSFPGPAGALIKVQPSIDCVLVLVELFCAETDCAVTRFG